MSYQNRVGFPALLLHLVTADILFIEALIDTADSAPRSRRMHLHAFTTYNYFLA